jgi:hypothetical protein
LKGEQEAIFPAIDMDVRRTYALTSRRRG